MSVLSSKRSISHVEFLKVLSELQSDVMKWAISQSPKYKDFGVKKLYECVENAFTLSFSANNNYPNSVEVIEKRIGNFKNAITYLHGFNAQMTAVNNIIPISNNDGYVLLFDYSNYFGSIDHEMIMNNVKKYVTDERILDLIQLFINEFDEGLGLGSQVSQVLSLFAASPIDHMIKDEMRFKYYIRYMDDGLIIHNDKKELEELLERIIQLSDKLGLTINKKKTHITSIKNFRFLKKRFSLLDNGRIIIKLSADSITRMRRKLKKFESLYHNGKMTFEHIETSYKSWRGFALQYNSYQSIKRLDEYYNKLIKNIKNKGGGNDG